MSIIDIFAYILGANYEYNERLKKLFTSAKLTDLCDDERILIGITPYNNTLYIKSKNNDSTISYYALEKTFGTFLLDGGNILIKEPLFLEEARQLINSKQQYSISKRFMERMRLTINDLEYYDVVLINKIGEVIELIIQSKGKILFFRYDYETNRFTANFDIDWYTLSETTVDQLYVPTQIKKFIANGGIPYEFKTNQKEIEIIDQKYQDGSKYFLRLR